MLSAIVETGRSAHQPESRTLELPIPRRRADQLVRALAVARNQEIGNCLMQAHQERMKKIAQEAEEQLRAFLELIANRD